MNWRADRSASSRAMATARHGVHYFTSSFMGLRVVAKAGDSPAQLRDIVDLTLAILD